MSDLAKEWEPAVRRRLDEERNVWLCTIRPDGSAHVTPVWFIHRRDRWWICSDQKSVKVRNVRREPRVSLALEDGRSPVVAEGSATVRGKDFPGDIVAAFERKYGWDISAPDASGREYVLLEVQVRRWLMAGTAP
ncbi:pyridoxamine 5'-phosphate oxidase family protein [Streptomyces sp. NPDC015131]|uniref:pyridoxamine 5'-phosphate oxidase family protein n=1 Tax=Streptomyces sp. NPDC015131 TaxID=3364941 RepID=UPI0036F75174